MGVLPTTVYIFSAFTSHVSDVSEVTYEPYDEAGDRTCIFGPD